MFKVFSFYKFVNIKSLKINKYLLQKFLTLNIRELNEYVSSDERVEQIIIPLGDGMTVCRVL